MVIVRIQVDTSRHRTTEVCNTSPGLAKLKANEFLGVSAGVKRPPCPPLHFHPTSVSWATLGA